MLLSNKFNKNIFSSTATSVLFLTGSEAYSLPQFSIPDHSVSSSGCTDTQIMQIESQTQA